MTGSDKESSEKVCEDMIGVHPLLLLGKLLGTRLLFVIQQNDEKPLLEWIVVSSNLLFVLSFATRLYKTRELDS